MIALLEQLRSGKVLVADGAMGTMLFRKGVQAGECPEAVNLTRLQLLEEIAAAYLEAGADVFETNTFGTSPAKLARYNL